MNTVFLTLQRIPWGIQWLRTRQPLRWLFSFPLNLLGRCGKFFSGSLSITSNGEPPPFVHRPLAAAGYFRILQLLPSPDPEAPIRCKLHHCQMRSPQYAYTAISYVWGNKDLPKRVIDCDGSRAEITPSLHSALSRLRSRTNDKYLWADALCIDQRKGTNTERSSQVRIMDEIYAGAEQVVIDLGLVEEDLNSVLPDLDRYHAIPSTRYSLIMSSPNMTSALSLLHKENVPEVDADFWVLFPRFMQRPWFTRVWIIQEFALAKAHHFMIGNEFRDGTYLQTAIVRAALHLSWLYTHTRYHSPRSEYPLKLSDGLYMISDATNAIQRILEVKARTVTNKYTFCELVSMSTVLFQATNIRDRAYALRGLASDANFKRELAVDYEEASDRFLLRLSRYLLRAGYSIYPLYHCVGIRKDCRSWALSLGDTLKDDLSLLVGASGKTYPPLFNACGASVQFSCMFSVIRQDGLLIHGCIQLDTIDQAMESSLPPKPSLTVQNPASSHSDWVGKAYLWISSMAQLLGLRDQHSREDFVKRCWRTLIADVMVDPDRESQGQVRTRDYSESELCLDTWTRTYETLHGSRQADAEAPSWFNDRDKTSTLIRIYGECLGFAFGRRLAMTKILRLPCLIPAAAEIGDCIVLVHGCQIPFVLRRDVDEKGVYFRIVGCVYVHGIMDSEILQQQAWPVEDLEIW